MSPSPHMIALYSRPIILWVEDLATRTYLGECWNDPDIAFLIAGGNEGVRSAVRSSQGDGFSHVFGFVDQDFGYTNRPGWNNPATLIFIPEVHEVENYLLAADHLAGCNVNNGGRSTADIEARLFACAGGMVWWTACRRVLTDLRVEFLYDFPAHSRVADLAEAERHICGSDWYRRLHPLLRTVVPAHKITARLTAAHGIAVAALAGGQWRQTFSGKELLRDLHMWLYTPPASGASTAAERDVDLARSVARWQILNGAVPQEVIDLRAVLRNRVGI